MSGKNGRPNLAAANEKESPTSQAISKAVGQKFITGPDGTKWVSIFSCSGLFICLFIFYLFFCQCCSYKINVFQPNTSKTRAIKVFSVEANPHNHIMIRVTSNIFSPVLLAYLTHEKSSLFDEFTCRYLFRISSYFVPLGGRLGAGCANESGWKSSSGFPG